MTDTLKQEQLDELATKPLDDMTGPELRSYAVSVLGLDVPEKVTEKAALRYIIDVALRSPAEASGVAGAEDATGEEIENLGEGVIRATRPIREVRTNGDWRDPFTGLLIWHGQDTNPENRAKVNRARDDRKLRRDQIGHVYMPVKVGDTVSVDRLVIEED